MSETNNSAPPPASAQALPLAGLRVIEFTQMVMGPTCGMVLADLGAEVIKIEPLEGDSTRRLLGAGAGFYPLFNRNKLSLSLDVKDPRGLEIVLKLLHGADVFSENFKSGAMDRLGLSFAALSRLNERLIYVSHKGFLPGPYEHRTALDEVVQMMGGLAYMTGRPGDPLRAGSSVNDIMGGMFGAIGVLAALQQRHASGRGQLVQSSLFENNIFLVAQHMMQFAITGKPAAPMPERISPWGIYDVFSVAGDEQIFLAVVSDTQWAIFCQAFGLSDLQADARLASNNQRVQARAWMMPELRRRLQACSAAEIAAVFEAAGLPFAPIARPEQLMDDPHLLATGGLGAMTLPDGRETRVPLLPLSLSGARLGLRMSPPRLGEHNQQLLRQLGYTENEIAVLLADRVVGAAGAA